MEAHKFCSIGIATSNHTFFVGYAHNSLFLVIKLNPGSRNSQYYYFPNGIVQGQVQFDAICAGYNYPIRGEEGMFLNVMYIGEGVAKGILKKIPSPKSAAISCDENASVPLSDILLMSDVATPCTEADLQDLKSTSSPVKSSMKPPVEHHYPSQVKAFRLPDAPAPPVQLVPGDNFADALLVAAMVFNKLVPSRVFFVYGNELVLHFEDKTILEIRQKLSDFLWERQERAWCGLHSLNSLRSDRDPRRTPGEMQEFQKVLQNENRAIGNLAGVHKDMVLPNGWMTVDFLQAYMTRVMNLQQPSTFLPEAPIQVTGKYAKLRAMHNSICESSLSNNAVAMVVLTADDDAHYYVFRKIRVVNHGEEKMHLAFFDSNYSAKN